MTVPNRRLFLLQIAACSGALVTDARAQSGTRVSEADPAAITLGYREDTQKVDARKYPKHDPSQKCGNCQLYQGKATDPWAPCPLFSGKLVANNAWCSAWTKKVA